MYDYRDKLAGTCTRDVRIETPLVIHILPDGKMSKFNVIIYQHLFMTNIEEICNANIGRRMILFTSRAGTGDRSSYLCLLK